MNYKDTFLSFCDSLEISKHKQKTGLEILARLGDHYEPLVKHSLNTGIVASVFADYALLNQGLAFTGGIFHDSGKLETPVEILSKTWDFDEKDMEIIKHHTLDGYRILNEKGLEFEAWIALTHHIHQKNPYPSELPILPKKFSKNSQLDLELYCPTISIADQLDATKRRNLRSLESKSMCTKDLLLENLPSLSESINKYCSPDLIKFHESLVSAA